MMVEPQTKAGRIGASAPQARNGRAIGVLGIPGDRRDDDQRQYGAIAAGCVRRDHRPRGQEPARPCARARPRRTSSRASAQARSDGSARAARAEKVLDEMTAVRTALRRAMPGDLVVCCVDDAIAVYREAMSATGAARGGTAFADPGELEAPEG